MKLRNLLPAIALSIACTLGAQAQAPQTPPTGSTGQCKDRSFTSTPTKSGACRGHKGIQQWFADTQKPSATVAAKATPAPAPKETPARSIPVPAPSKPSPSTPAPTRGVPPPPANAAAGGGPGMVWVNTETKVYHCPATRYYGKTKQGKYMSESDAKNMGARPDAGKPCK